MLTVIQTRLRQKHRTVPYPSKAPLLPPHFAGRPSIKEHCQALAGKDCELCSKVCPTKAIQACGHDGPSLDMGLCTFCGRCAAHCPEKAIQFTQDWRLASTHRQDLIITAATPSCKGDTANDYYNDTSVASVLAQPLEKDLLRIFRYSIRLRQVTAAGCGACEADINVLNTIVFDLPRFGIDVVASPRHADALIVTGPVSKNMQLALSKCWHAVPEPKIIIAVGACAISGGLFRELSGNGHGLAPSTYKPSLYIPGCPPNPYTILDGLLRMLGRI